MNKYKSMSLRRGKRKQRQCNAIATRAATYTSRAFGLCLTAALCFAAYQAEEQQQRAVDIAELHCAALNVYMESRGESLADQYAVALVTRNRVNSSEFPNSYCEVVYQPYQFSWTLAPYPVQDAKAWEKAIEVAGDVMNGAPDITEGADHFYNPAKVQPKWAANEYDVVELEGHKYVKVRG